MRTLIDKLDRSTLRSVLLILLAIALVSTIFWLSSRLIGVEQDGRLSLIFKSLTDSNWAFPVVIATFTLASFIGVPQFVLIAITVAAFGPVKGFIFSYVATLISSTVNFQVARQLGASWIRRRGWTTVEHVSALVGRNGFFSAMVVRVVPTAPFVVVNMGLGLTHMAYLSFLSGTAVGTIPKTALIALLGKVVERAQAGDPQAIQYLVMAALGWVVLAFAARWLLQKRERSRSGGGVAK